MKFDDIKSEQKQFSKKESKKEKGIHDFFDIKTSMLNYKLYPNIAIYYVQENKKFPLSFLSTLLNNGTTQPSWIIRYYTENDEWNIQFTPNYNATFNIPDFSSVVESLNKKFEISSFQYKNQIIFPNIKEKEKTEDIIQILIDVFKDKELDFEDKSIDLKFQIRESSDPFKIPFIVLDEEQMKYKKFIERIKTKNLANDDKVVFEKLEADILNKNKISEEDIKIIKNLVEEYLSESEKIETVMVSLYAKTKFNK